MKINWQEIKIAADETRHVFADQPVYTKNFFKVLKFHAPGLAAVVDATGAYHIDISGEASYPARFLQTFGYYAGLAAVQSAAGWCHINVQGHPVYPEHYAWCGNFQEDFCPVQDLHSRSYFHIDAQGQRHYQECYRYVGDFRDGIAVVCNQEGLHTHIDAAGRYLHGQWFLGLDVFHKGVARAKDNQGWLHIDKAGKALYKQRYTTVEPYYNNVAHVEDSHGNLYTIDLSGEVITCIYTNDYAVFHQLSTDVVGFWKTQTIYAAVKLGIFEILPATLENIATFSALQPQICRRLLRALQEVNLVQQQPNNSWQCTAKGALLHTKHKNSLAAAVIIWGESHYQQWTQLLTELRRPTANTRQYFAQLAGDQHLISTYQQALKIYAEQDYLLISKVIDWAQHKYVIDAGGGMAVLLHNLLTTYPHLRGVLLELPAVIQLITPHPRCKYCPTDLLEPWAYQADALILSRVLHDWTDEQAAEILLHAKNSLLANGKIYVVELILAADGANGGLLDLNMLVMTGGRERTLSDWQQLIARAELTLTRVINLSAIVNILVLEDLK